MSPSPSVKILALLNQFQAANLINSDTLRQIQMLQYLFFDQTQFPCNITQNNIRSLLLYIHNILPIIILYNQKKCSSKDIPKHITEDIQKLLPYLGQKNKCNIPLDVNLVFERILVKYNDLPISLLRDNENIGFDIFSENLYTYSIRTVEDWDNVEDWDKHLRIPFFNRVIIIINKYLNQFGIVNENNDANANVSEGNKISTYHSLLFYLHDFIYKLNKNKSKKYILDGIYNNVFLFIENNGTFIQNNKYINYESLIFKLIDIFKSYDDLIHLLKTQIKSMGCRSLSSTEEYVQVHDYTAQNLFSSSSLRCCKFNKGSTMEKYDYIDKIIFLLDSIQGCDVLNPTSDFLLCSKHATVLLFLYAWKQVCLQTMQEYINNCFLFHYKEDISLFDIFFILFSEYTEDFDAVLKAVINKSVLQNISLISTLNETISSDYCLSNIIINCLQVAQIRSTEFYITSNIQ
jgi:hypothetical protein